jgi:hypothetical protein
VSVRAATHRRAELLLLRRDGGDPVLGPVHDYTS